VTFAFPLCAATFLSINRNQFVLLLPVVVSVSLSRTKMRIRLFIHKKKKNKKKKKKTGRRFIDAILRDSIDGPNIFGNESQDKRPIDTDRLFSMARRRNVNRI